jgi:hypothetical protein
MTIVMYSLDHDMTIVMLARYRTKFTRRPERLLAGRTCLS